MMNVTYKSPITNDPIITLVEIFTELSGCNIDIYYSTHVEDYGKIEWQDNSHITLNTYECLYLTPIIILNPMYSMQTLVPVLSNFLGRVLHYNLGVNPKYTEEECTMMIWNKFQNKATGWWSEVL